MGGGVGSGGTEGGQERECGCGGGAARVERRVREGEEERQGGGRGEEPRGERGGNEGGGERDRGWRGEAPRVERCGSECGDFLKCGRQADDLRVVCSWN